MSSHFAIIRVGAVRAIKSRGRQWQNMNFGNRLRLARKSVGISQAHLAQMCGWGEAQTRIANYESGAREPTLSDIQLLAKHTGVPPEELAFGTTGLTGEQLELVQAWQLGNEDARVMLRSAARLAIAQRQFKRQINKVE